MTTPSPQQGPRQSKRRLFLERDTYRRNRIADAARLLPLLAVAMLLLPDLLLSDPSVAKGATAPWLVYFFCAWLTLIALAAWLARKVTRHGPDAPAPPPQPSLPLPPPPDR